MEPSSQRFEVEQFIEDMAQLPIEAQRDKVTEKINELSEEIDSIAYQISRASGQARNEGVFADTDWWARINLARRIKGRQVQRLQTQLNILRRRAHAERIARKKTDAEKKDVVTAKRDRFAIAFFMAAEVVLSKADFDKVCAEARKIIVNLVD